MFGDFGGSSVLGGPFMVSLVAYALISYFISGPFIADRMIQLGGLEEKCSISLRSRAGSLSKARADELCGCASGAMIDKHRMSFALMAGSFRLISPAAISRNLNQEFTRIAASRECR